MRNALEIAAKVVVRMNIRNRKHPLSRSDVIMVGCCSKMYPNFLLTLSDFSNLAVFHSNKENRKGQRTNHILADQTTFVFLY